MRYVKVEFISKLGFMVLSTPTNDKLNLVSLLPSSIIKYEELLSSALSFKICVKAFKDFEVLYPK